MYIDIDTEAKNWIESKGQELTVKTLDINVCCAPNLKEIVAIPGKPKTFEQYNQIIADGLIIYVQKSLFNKSRLKLKLSGISFLKSISAVLE
ncbi:CC/Se motif family (seleno)protein [Neobacillus sp. PS3-12]|jgi:hypothetical protein|uniref:CC/Se motif family (seleno)protein n=1 Tax=Neobacillus sp. PS3-12 TaxID=3070677 RepID=UPI0027E0C001|nr:CC/Se motif family (seleno)protein [Neobacillus sp. PS3-12]WML52605.1 CC/Se motif family (seleno)protein [Neobacillus sp. PS3-12]